MSRDFLTLPVPARRRYRCGRRGVLGMGHMAMGKVVVERAKAEQMVALLRRALKATKSYSETFDRLAEEMAKLNGQPYHDLAVEAFRAQAFQAWESGQTFDLGIRIGERILAGKKE